MADNTGRRMMVGGAARTFGLVVRMVGGFMMLPFLVAMLGDYWYGVFTATLGLVANFHLMDFGFAQATMRQIAMGLAKSDDREVNLTINTAMRIYTILGSIVLALILVSVGVAGSFVDSADTASKVRWILLIIGVDLALTFPMKAFAGIVQAQMRYDLLVVIELITFGVTVAGNVWVLLNGYGVVALAVVAFISGQLNNVMFVMLAKRLFPGLKINWKWLAGYDRSRSRELALYSTWSFLIQLAYQFRFRIDSLTVGGLMGGAAVTQYAIGSRIIEYAQSPLVLVLNTALPALTRLHVDNQKERMAEVVLFLLRFSLLLAVFAGGIVFAVGDAFIRRWIGAGHEQSYLIAVVLAVGFMTEVFLLPLTNWLYASANHKMLAIANIIEAMVNVALSIILGRKFGLVGVAIGTVVPLLLMQLFWVLPQASRLLEVPIRRFVALAIPAAISISTVMVAAVLVRATADSNGYVGIVLAGAVMTAIYWPIVLFVCLGRQHRGFIWRALPLPAMARG